ncbi:PQQ-binding-like beta-propeller repeat protein [Thermococcus piezophilus]|uniref:outer membrane protein assembly factor BamB family protein n=1 Tax=Thermococcus piezophilus TaxID=1712654 RepID=UPI0019020035|nr:PQQ-binding-like beta-propeller repeat protein [Thermococcus piezophilus]
MILVLILALSVLGTVTADDNPILWKGTVCDDVQYQKSIEAVAINDGRVYAGCSYRQLVNSSGMIGIYYLGQLVAYSFNGTFLWQNDSGYVVELYPLSSGKVIVGTIGGFVTFDENGKFLSRNLTINKLYDFQILDNTVYAVDGDFFLENDSVTYVGHLYRGEIINDSVVLNSWIVNFTSLVSRVRVGEGIIYIGAGFPSGYVGPRQFGFVYGVLPNGTLSWTVETGQWVRDMELFGNDVIAGTGKGTSEGYLYRIDPSGNVVWKRRLFYTEDIEIADGRIYVGGMGNGNGVLAAIDPETGNMLWNQTFPFRVKVVKYVNGTLLVGVGKFESRQENGTTIIYTYGSLYALDAKTGKILGAVTDIGYVRSIAVEGNVAIVGTASSYFYVVDIGKLAGKKNRGICGPAVLVGLVIIPLLRRKH